MTWWRRRRQAEVEAKEALAAKIAASVELAAARQTKSEVKEQSDTLREINRRNHFSEGLARAMRGKPA